MSARVINVKSLTFYDADDIAASSTMDEDLVSDWIDISGCDAGVQIAATHTAGTAPVGVLRLQASNDPDAVKLDAVDIPDTDIAVPITAPAVGSSVAGATGLTGHWAIDGQAKPGKYVRVVFDFTSGTAALSAIAEGQGMNT